MLRSPSGYPPLLWWLEIRMATIPYQGLQAEPLASTSTRLEKLSNKSLETMKKWYPTSGVLSGEFHIISPDLGNPYYDTLDREGFCRNISNLSGDVREPDHHGGFSSRTRYQSLRQPPLALDLFPPKTDDTASLAYLGAWRSAGVWCDGLEYREVRRWSFRRWQLWTFSRIARRRWRIQAKLRKRQLVLGSNTGIEEG